ncbi:MAG: four-carbon acid sugar kinase family protein [Rhizobiales bacterium]|nr:four-carbon acid sugar kinase family protein [Hyphomicrobiales bacterium]
MVADDLTGGMETAAMLVALGVDCGFVTRPERVAEAVPAPAVVVAQKTRVVPPGEAVAKAEAAGRALREAGARQLYFKYCATFDSTDRGNIGPVAEALLALTGAPLTGYCPSSDELGRTVYNGHMFVGRQLLSESPKRHDPLTPMTDPDLVRVLGRQTTMPVGLAPHQAVSAGPAALRTHVASLKRDGIRHVILDAIYARDLAAIAEVVVSWPLMTGNATLVRHYPALWRARGEIDAAPARRGLPAVDGFGVVLAGSCAERSLEQLAEFERHRPVLRIDVGAIADPEAEIARASDWAMAHLADGPVAIATSAPVDEVRVAQEKLGVAGAAAAAEAVLGGLAVALRTRGVRRFLVAGGETSGSVVERLGIDRLHVGPYRGPGIGRAVSEGAEPLALSLKSGKLGPVDMFLPTLESMRATEA